MKKAIIINHCIEDSATHHLEELLHRNNIKYYILELNIDGKDIYDIEGRGRNYQWKAWENIDEIYLNKSAMKHLENIMNTYPDANLLDKKLYFI